MARKTKTWEYKGIQVEPTVDGQCWQIDADGIIYEVETEAQARTVIDHICQKRQDQDRAWRAVQAMVDDGVAGWRAWVMWAVVRIVGGKYWHADD